MIFDPTPFMQYWADTCMLRNERSLRERQGPGGSPLADNADSYKNTRRKRGKPVGVLSGRMMGNLLHPANVRPRGWTHYVVTPCPARRENVIKINTFIKGQDPNRELTYKYRSGRTGEVVTVRRILRRAQPARDFIGIDPDELEGKVADKMATEFLSQWGWK